jgi:hypothetical protein
MPAKGRIALKIRETYQDPVLEIRDMNVSAAFGETESRKYATFLTLLFPCLDRFARL